MGSVAAIVGAVYLIANGYDHGWGWLLVIAVVGIDAPLVVIKKDA